MTEREIHPQWKELMEYVENNGGFLRLELRFQDGLPVVAEEVRKQVRFGINNNKGKPRRYEVINGARRKRLLKNPAIRNRLQISVQSVLFNLTEALRGLSFECFFYCREMANK